MEKPLFYWTETSIFHLNISFEKTAISTMPLLCYQHNTIKALNKMHFYCCVLFGKCTSSRKANMHSASTDCNSRSKKPLSINRCLNQKSRDFPQVRVLLHHVLTKSSRSNSTVAKYFVLKIHTKKSVSFLEMSLLLLTVSW